MFIIKDNFYSNPYDVRAYALGLDFNVSGNFPGTRTAPYEEPYFTEMKHALEDIINKKIIYWPDGYNTAFQYTTKDSKTWVHYDQTQWAGVVYLTPNAPIESGTAICQHKQTKIYRHAPDQTDYNEGGHEEEDWDLLDFCGNIFNRIVIYEGSLYHRSLLPGFGNTKYNGRLFQTFFFNTDKTW